MYAKDNKSASQNHQTPKDNSSWLKPRPFAPSPKKATQISTTPEEIKHQETANVTRRTNLLEILLSTQSEHNVVQRMPNKKKLKNQEVEQEVPGASEQGTVNEEEQPAPQTTIAALPTAEIEQEQTEEDPPQTTTASKKKKKKKKKKVELEASEQGTVNEQEQAAPQTTTAALPTAKIEQEQTEEDPSQTITVLNKGKNKEVEQEATGASGQGTVNEGEQTPPQSTTVALSIFQNKMQECQQKANLILGQLLQLKPEVEADNPNSGLAGLLKAWEPALNDSLKKTNTFVDNLQKIEQDIQNKTRIIRLTEARINDLKSQSSNDEEYKKKQDFLETQQAKVREAVSPLETEFFQLCNEYIGIINLGMTHFTKVEEIFAPRKEESELNIQELSLSKKTKNEFVDIFEHAILELKNLYLRLSKLLQNAIAENLLDEKDISQVSNDIEDWRKKYDAIKNRYTKFQNKQNKKEEEIVEFVTNYNSQIRAHDRLDQKANNLLSEISKPSTSSSKKRQYQKEIDELVKTETGLRKKRIVDHGIYESKIKKDIDNWNNTYEEVKKNVALRYLLC